MEVHTRMCDGEEAWSLASPRTRRWMDGRKAQSQIFLSDIQMAAREFR